MTQWGGRPWRLRELELRVSARVWRLYVDMESAQKEAGRKFRGEVT